MEPCIACDQREDRCVQTHPGRACDACRIAKRKCSVIGKFILQFSNYIVILISISGPRSINLFDQRKMRQLASVGEDLSYLTARIKRDRDNLSKASLSLVGFLDSGDDKPAKSAKGAISQVHFQMQQLGDTIQLFEKATVQLEDFIELLEETTTPAVGGKQPSQPVKKANEDGCDDEVLNLLKF
jgi:hypothetical protein